VNNATPITVNVAGDDTIMAVRVNGVAIAGPASSGYVAFNTFTINSSALTVGTNTLDFDVHNAGTAVNPSGFRAEFTWANSVPPPVHWWKLDESSGTTAADSAGANNGSTFNSPTWSPTGGEIGGCLNLSGPSWQGVSLGTFDLTSKYTLSAWVNLSSSASSCQGIFSNKMPGSNSNGCAFYINTWATSDHLLRFETGNGGGGNGVVSTVAVTPGVWQHVAVTVDNTMGTVKLYLNGVDVTGSGGITTNAGTNLAAYLGNFVDGSLGFTGSLDDVRIYNSVLNAAAIVSIYSGN
jgi:hypothetical protein